MIPNETASGQLTTAYSQWLDVLVEYSDVSTNTVLIMDYVIIFPREVDLIWKARWNFAKAIYVVARYTSFSVIVPLIVRRLHKPKPSLCFLLNVFTIWAGFFAYASGEIIFGLRTCAIWEWSRWIRRLLFGLYTLCIGTQFALVIIGTRTLNNNVGNSGNSHCQIGPPDHSLTYIGLACLLFFETVVGCLTCIKAHHHLRGTEASRTPLIVALYRDGLLFYIYIAAVSLANILVIALGPPSMFRLIFGLQRVLHSILSIRVMLHIREVFAYNGTEETEMLIATFSGMSVGTDSAHVDEDWELRCRRPSSILEEAT